MMLTDLAKVCRAAGLVVIEVPDWQTEDHGPMVDVLGVTCHHTANGGAQGNMPSLGVVRDGRPGLPGPLAHLGLGRDGTVYVVAAGKCYHAGVSREPGYTNGHRIGIEAEAAGDGRPTDWPVAQMSAYHLLCKALADHYGFDVADVLGHKETCAPVGRKTDPSFSMTTFRDGVEHAVIGVLDMPLNESDLDAIGKLVDATITKRIPDIAKAVARETVNGHYVPIIDSHGDKATSTLGVVTVAAKDYAKRAATNTEAAPPAGPVKLDDGTEAHL